MDNTPDADYDKRMHMISISEEKATAASNYVAFYGFLNLLAVGLLFYIAKH
jgi:hypothetical protein